MMTQEKWDSLNPAERERTRDNSALSPQLIGKEGYRVEALTVYGEKRRFIVGKSTGWVPCHIELAQRNSSGGNQASREYVSVRTLEKVR